MFPDGWVVDVAAKSHSDESLPYTMLAVAQDVCGKSKPTAAKNRGLTSQPQAGNGLFGIHITIERQWELSLSRF